MWEWNEAEIGSYRGLRGGSFLNSDNTLHPAFRSFATSPANESAAFGFRVAEVP